MKAYLFQATLLCEDCGNAVKEQTPAPEGVDPQNPDESLYDSSEWPKALIRKAAGKRIRPNAATIVAFFWKTL